VVERLLRVDASDQAPRKSNWKRIQLLGYGYLGCDSQNWPVITNHSSSIAGFAEHQGGKKFAPRWHPINATESERKTFRGAVQIHAAELDRQGWTSSLIA